MATDQKKTPEQKITLKVAGKTYKLSIDPSKEEIYRLAEKEVNSMVASYEKAKIDGFATQDCIAMVALQMAIYNIRLSQSREMNDEDVQRVAELSAQIDDYFSKL